MMSFTAHTRVHEMRLVPGTFPNSNVHLQTSWVDVLHTWLNKAEYTSDTLGILAGCSHIKRQNTSKGIKPLHNVFVIDEKEKKAVVPLWDQQSHAFDEILLESAKLFEGFMPLPQGGGYKCTGSTFIGTNGNPRYRLAILVSDPIDPPNGDEPPAVEMVLFGATVRGVCHGPIRPIECSIRSVCPREGRVDEAELRRVPWPNVLGRGPPERGRARGAAMPVLPVLDGRRLAMREHVEAHEPRDHARGPALVPSPAAVDGGAPAAEVWISRGYPGRAVAASTTARCRNLRP